MPRLKSLLVMSDVITDASLRLAGEFVVRIFQESHLLRHPYLIALLVWRSTASS